jgi:hypothetical protein
MVTGMHVLRAGNGGASGPACQRRGRSRPTAAPALAGADVATFANRLDTFVPFPPIRRNARPSTAPQYRATVIATKVIDVTRTSGRDT